MTNRKRVPISQQLGATTLTKQRQLQSVFLHSQLLKLAQGPCEPRRGEASSHEVSSMLIHDVDFCTPPECSKHRLKRLTVHISVDPAISLASLQTANEFTMSFLFPVNALQVAGKVNGLRHAICHLQIFFLRCVGALNPPHIALCIFLMLGH